jgi:hypothetical protein
MEYREMDEHLNQLTGREAVIKKVEIILGIREGQLPHYPSGLPIEEFTNVDPGKMINYIKSELARDNISCEITYENGRFFFLDLNASYTL